MELRRQEHPAQAVIRDATPPESSAIAELTARVYLDGGYSPPSREAFLRDVATRSAAGDLLVAVDPSSGEIIGAVTLARVDSGYAPLAGAGQAEVRLLAVSPAARRIGAGTLLMQTLLCRAKEQGLHGLILSTSSSMTAAHRIYERLGFHRLPERDYRSGTGQTMLVYSLSFERS